MDFVIKNTEIKNPNNSKSLRQHHGNNGQLNEICIHDTIKNITK